MEQPEPAASMSEDTSVMLKCVKEKGKLRVKIVTPGYLSTCNVQFPRDIRIEGRMYKVDKKYISLVTTRGKYFYTVSRPFHVRGNVIQIVEGVSSADAQAIVDEHTRSYLETIKDHVLYEDLSSTECCICMSEPKDVVFMPCFHFYCCSGCSERLSKCPICRMPVERKISSSLFS